MGPNVTDIFDLEQTTEEILLYCLGELGAESGSIFLMDGSNKCLQLVKAVGERANHHSGTNIRLGEGVSGHAAAIKQPMLVEDCSKEAQFASREEARLAETFMSCPVLMESSILGVINIAGHKEGRSFAADDLKKFEAIAKQCAPLLGQVVDYWQPERDQKQASTKAADIEKQFQDLKEYNASVLECFSQPVLIFDRQLFIAHWSMEKVFKWLAIDPTKSQKKQSILDLPFDIEGAELKNKLNAMLMNGTRFSFKNVKVKNVPETRVLNLFFSPFFSSIDQILGGLLMMEDNTENYEMRQRLLNAEKLSLVGSLTSMITHEINNPLDGVMRLINLSLNRIDEDDPVREYLTEAQTGVQRIASLVSSLLTFSRKSVSLDAEHAPLNTIIDNAVSIVSRRNEGKDILLHLDLDEKNPPVNTNDFYQIIGNLLSNAFDSIESANGNVRLETRLDGDRFYIGVGDDGAGIPENMRSRIFNTFWTTKEYGKGTGLGLAIVKKLIEKYDGDIDIESEEGVGTKMHLTFPLGKIIF